MVGNRFIFWDLFFDAYEVRTFGRGVFQPEVINPSIERFFSPSLMKFFS